MATYGITVSNNSITANLETTTHTVSLSRTGGQGSKGDSVSSIAMDGNYDLIVTYVASDGTTTVDNIGGSDFYTAMQTALTGAQTAETNAEAALATFQQSFLGAFATAPSSPSGRAGL